MKDISDIIKAELLLSVGREHVEHITVDHDTADKLRSIAKNGEKITVGNKLYPVIITNMNIESAKGRTTVDVELTLRGVIAP